ILATAICVSCTLFNAVLLIHARFTSFVGSPSQSMTNYARLPRPNQYIGLDTINRTEHPFTAKPIINFAPLLTQVSEAEPTLVFPVDSHRWFSWIGTLSPDDRHFYVDNKVHTIAQFRTHDYGMEACQLTAILSPIDSPDDNRGITSLSSQVAAVYVWRLDVDHDLDPSTLSWSKLHVPSRLERIGRLDLSEGTTTKTEHFRCRQDSLQTFL
ncbi:hypothetical protein K488DRAFT_26743, partial [Vararia minispora EC-137]